MQATPYPKFDVGIVFVSNEEIQERNREDRGVDTPTDILSYPFNDIEKPGIIPREELRYRTLGDMLISAPYVMQYCREQNVDISDHLPILVAHGLCHLLGYDHETDEEWEVMKREEQKLLEHWEKNKWSGWHPLKIGGTRTKIRKEYNFMNFEDL